MARKQVQQSFHFKQFSVRQDQCAMKVGTDGVLLGTWVDTSNAKHILDLGTGTGLVSLMLAQRSQSSHITAIEIDQQTAQQAQDNFVRSKWQQRITLIHDDVMKILENYPHFAQYFDLIVANPPYFLTANECRDNQRETARYLGQYTHLDWLLTAQQLLTPQGKIYFVLPFAAGQTLLNQLIDTPLVCSCECRVITKQGKAPQRVLLCFEQKVNVKSAEKKIEYLTIYTQQHQYHSDVLPLFTPFYLKL